jgi:hypothetical protein
MSLDGAAAMMNASPQGRMPNLYKEYSMTVKTSLAIAALPLAILAGCASLSKEDRALLDSAAQNAEAAKTTSQQALEAARAAQTSAEQANGTAQKAADQATQAAQAAQSASASAAAASAKTDRIFAHSLHKTAPPAQ